MAIKIYVGNNEQADWSGDFPDFKPIVTVGETVDVCRVLNTNSGYESYMIGRVSINEGVNENNAIHYNQGKYIVTALCNGYAYCEIDNQREK